MIQYTYKQKLGLQDQRGKGILVGKLFSGCVSVGKSLNLWSGFPNLQNEGVELYHPKELTKF